MNVMTEARSGPRHHLPHNGQELPGAPPPDASSPELAERNAETFVRQMIVVQKREQNLKCLPTLSPADPVAPTPLGDGDAERPSRAAGSDQPSGRPAVSGTKSATQEQPRRRLMPNLALPRPKLRLASRRGTERKAGGRGLALPARLLGYRPTLRHAILAALAMVMVLRPLLLPLVILLTFWVVLIAYLTIGPDRWSEILAAAFRRYAERKPEKAERLRRQADAVAVKIDGLLDWLPDRWADRLSLPDFSQPFAQAQADARPDPFDRLAAEARRG